MTIVTAKVAGVRRVAACTPPIWGEVPAATIAAISMAGADEIYVLRRVQAVAASTARLAGGAGHHQRDARA
jgi:sulfopropanediol 3-dehydrogenase